MATGFLIIVKIFRQIGSQTLGLQNSQNLVTGDEPDLCNTMGIPEDDTNLRGGQTLLGQLENVFLDLIGSQFQPVGNTTAVRQSRLGNTLSGSVHTNHGEAAFAMELNRKR